jgi:hypothetical protein
VQLRRAPLFLAGAWRLTNAEREVPRQHATQARTRSKKHELSISGQKLLEASLRHSVRSCLSPFRGRERRQSWMRKTTEPLDYRWTTAGLPLDYRWTTAGLPLDYRWTTAGTRRSLRMASPASYVAPLARTVDDPRVRASLLTRVGIYLDNVARSLASREGNSNG